MKREVIPDFFEVRTEHRQIHDRLCNWARVVRVNAVSITPQPMFQHYRSTDVWAEQAPSIPADLLDGWKLEKQVGQLPEKHRDAVRWYYVYPHRHQGKVQRLLAVTRTGLNDLIHDGRSMLRNRS